MLLLYCKLMKGASDMLDTSQLRQPQAAQTCCQVRQWCNGGMQQHQPEVGAAVVALPAGGVYAEGVQP
jgi:hypothetical protein